MMQISKIRSAPYIFAIILILLVTICVCKPLSNTETVLPSKRFPLRLGPIAYKPISPKKGQEAFKINTKNDVTIVRMNKRVELRPTAQNIISNKTDNVTKFTSKDRPKRDGTDISTAVSKLQNVRAEDVQTHKASTKGVKANEIDTKWSPKVNTKASIQQKNDDAKDSKSDKMEKRINGPDAKLVDVSHSQEIADDVSASSQIPAAEEEISDTKISKSSNIKKGEIESATENSKSSRKFDAELGNKLVDDESKNEKTENGTKILARFSSTKTNIEDKLKIKKNGGKKPAVEEEKVDERENYLAEVVDERGNKEVKQSANLTEKVDEGENEEVKPSVNVTRNVVPPNKSDETRNLPKKDMKNENDKLSDVPLKIAEAKVADEKTSTKKDRKSDVIETKIMSSNDDIKLFSKTSGAKPVKVGSEVIRKLKITDKMDLSITD